MKHLATRARCANFMHFVDDSRKDGNKIDADIDDHDSLRDRQTINHLSFDKKLLRINGKKAIEISFIISISLLLKPALLISINIMNFIKFMNFFFFFKKGTSLKRIYIREKQVK